MSSCLFHGVGCKKNREEAMKWLRMAADQGHQKAHGHKRLWSRM
ncbi:MAG: SEL1-like repeat protein [Thermoguttaceae bacterium]|nr:SEL1-like repeat protein [Thermoguttaceae bacterium]MBQ6620295.1 SEL1-like repeat protein [Thermoguttaceae bacterium]